MVDLTRPVVVLTGAGVSAESGIPTFRGSGGLWKQYRAMDLATPQAFRRDPRLVWEFYEWRREVVARCEPNRAHQTIAAMEKSLGFFTLITQNIDGLHERAGNRRVLSLHGDIWRVRCTRCDFQRSDALAPLPQIPPPCPDCDGLLRPAVVWFGEPLPADVLGAAWDACSEAKLMLVVGTSALVQPAASLPLIARENGAHIVEINPDDTPLSPYAHETLRAPAGQVLPQWWKKIQTAA